MRELRQLNGEPAQAICPGGAPPVLRKLTDFGPPAPDSTHEILKHRYLCKGGGMLLIGSTGAGKSSLIMQCAMLWALGREAFGIAPARPLRILIVQGENDDYDMFEAMDGVRQGLELSDEDWARAVENIRVARESSRTGSGFFQHALRPCLEEFRPDLAFIDPAFQYLGGETNSQRDVTEFLRTYLNPLLEEFQFGVIINHHTNKPPNAKDAKSGGWSDMQQAYAGAGSAEWANWARAVMLLQEVPKVPGAYNLVAAKRGARLRWRETDGETLAFRKAICHSRQEGVIYWREMTEDETAEVAAQRAESASSRIIPDEDILCLLDDMPLTQSEWLTKAQRFLHIAKSTFNNHLRELKLSGAVVQEGRRYHRAPQPSNPVREIRRREGVED